MERIAREPGAEGVVAAERECFSFVLRIKTGVVPRDGDLQRSHEKCTSKRSAQVHKAVFYSFEAQRARSWLMMVPVTSQLKYFQA